MSLKYNSAIDLRTGERISIDVLASIKSGDERLNYLGCPFCGCELTLNHQGSSRGPYLSTKRGHKHSEECIKKVQAEVRKERFEAVAHDDIYLTPEAQHARAVNFARSFKRMLKSRDLKPKGKGRRKVSKSKRIGKDTKTVGGIVHRASINPRVGKKINNERVRLSAATPVNVNRYINRTIKFAGLLEQITLGKESATISVSYEGIKTNIIMNPAFFKQSSIEYKTSLKSLIRLINVTKKHPLVTAIVDVVPDFKGNPECLVRIDNALCFDGLSLEMYLYKEK